MPMQQAGDGGFARAAAADQPEHRAGPIAKLTSSSAGVLVPSYLKVTSSKLIAPSNFGRRPWVSARLSVGRLSTQPT